MRGIAALTPDGPYIAALKQPSDNTEVTFRTEGLLTKTTLFRASFERGGDQRNNQGISELDLPERGYRRNDVDYSARLSLEGGQRRPFHLRFQYDHRRLTSIPDTIAPAIIVQNAFRSGGATINGSNRSRAIVSDNMFTLRARPYTLRVGTLMTLSYSEQGQLTNALGTFTFTDLESSSAGRPATFSQRSTRSRWRSGSARVRRSSRPSSRCARAGRSAWACATGGRRASTIAGRLRRASA